LVVLDILLVSLMPPAIAFNTIKCLGLLLGPKDESVEPLLMIMT
jgi:hypothetical protein